MSAHDVSYFATVCALFGYTPCDLASQERKINKLLIENPLPQ
jgi:hypothetical protein